MNENYLILENFQISGGGFNGSIGLSMYDDTKLFTPKNTTKEKLATSSVKSITTEFKSNDIDVNLTYGLKMNCNSRFNDFMKSTDMVEKNLPTVV